MQLQRSTNWEGHSLGRYRMLRLLGRGGMGEVWLAEDSELRRQIAVKILPAVVASDEHYLRAFEYEARAAAALEHPHILTVHDFGEESSGTTIVPYLVLPYISGGSLRERMRTGAISHEDSLHYLRQAAEAIDYAHSQQVLHRDIKPANMLLQDKWLFLADFGLAKLLSTTTQRSSTHKGAGTPEYMAPEQARGHAEAASDRYSLAVTAYQLFTGKLPFRGETAYDIMIKHIREQPPAPRSIQPALSQDVEDILLHGLAKEPPERPASCLAFVDALAGACQLSQKPVTGEMHAHATGFMPWSKRLREHAETSQLPFSATPTPSFWDSQHLPQPSVSQIQTTRLNPDHAPTTTTGSTPSATPLLQGAETRTVQHPQGAEATSASTVYGTHNAPQAATYQATALNLPDMVGQQEHTAKPGPLSNVGRRSFIVGAAAAAIVVAGGGAAFYSTMLSHRQTPSAPSVVIPGPQKFMAGIPTINLTGHSRTVTGAVWDPTGRYLATSSEDHSVMVWDLGSYLSQQKSQLISLSKPLRSWRFSSSIEFNALAWSPSGRQLIATVIGDENKVQFLDVFGHTTQPVIYSNQAMTQDAFAPIYGYLAWSPHLNYFATSIFESRKVVMWQQGKTDVPFKVLNYDQGSGTQDGMTIMVNELAWSIDGSMLAGLTNNSNIVIWDIPSGKIKRTISLPDAPGIPPKQKVIFLLRSILQWSPIQSKLIMATNINVASIWDTVRNVQLMQLGTDDKEANTPPPPDKNNPFSTTWNPNMTAMSWSPNGRYVAGGFGRSNRLYVWDLLAKAPRTSKLGVRMPQYTFGDTNGHRQTISDVSWSPNGHFLASSSFDSTVIIWKVDSSA